MCKIRVCTCKSVIISNWFGLANNVHFVFLFFFRKRSKDIPQKYIKAVYREYIDSTYTVPKPRAAWTGRSL